MTFDELSARFRVHLEVRNCAWGTVRTSVSALRTLFRFFAETKVPDVAAVTTATLHDFQRWHHYEPTIHGAARKVTHQNRVLSVVRGFFRFLYATGLIAHDPAATLEYAREPRSLPRNILTPQEARKIILAADTGTVLGYRDRTLLEVLYATGIRKNELMNLCLDNVQLDEELLRINSGKGDRDRVVPLTAVACSCLETYLKAIRPQLLGKKKSERVFVSLRGQPMARNTVGSVVEKYATKARIKKRVTCHLWRHSCATHLLQNKANLRHVQEILGHRSLATTERYLHLTITELKEAHRRYHPREKDVAR
jgi:integrase/recombinase XerD